MGSVDLNPADADSFLQIPIYDHGLRPGAATFFRISFTVMTACSLNNEQDYRQIRACHFTI